MRVFQLLVLAIVAIAFSPAHASFDRAGDLLPVRELAPDQDGPTWMDPGTVWVYDMTYGPYPARLHEVESAPIMRGTVETHVKSAVLKACDGQVLGKGLLVLRVVRRAVIAIGGQQKLAVELAVDRDDLCYFGLSRIYWIKIYDVWCWYLQSEDAPLRYALRPFLFDDEMQGSVRTPFDPNDRLTYVGRLSVHDEWGGPYREFERSLDPPAERLTVVLARTAGIGNTGDTIDFGRHFTERTVFGHPGLISLTQRYFPGAVSMRWQLKSFTPPPGWRK